MNEISLIAMSIDYHGGIYHSHRWHRARIGRSSGPRPGFECHRTATGRGQHHYPNAICRAGDG